ncbi:MAG: chromosome segregation protein SMC [Gammaproteobacteria bacterium]|nr:chromosome segregation protein SMC [Gammaproteobacteria bacterium]
MRLKQIKLSGFKSFVDPTSLVLDSNLVGVVGPNGCGKSNVIDAVRWVLGESSAKQLRGVSMEDVIFNGSAGRKPVGQASIDLVFDNRDGAIGGQYAGYAEIAIKRRIGRDAQSHYFLNGSRCRRRDITDIFLGTGLGPRSYAIIEQGMISRIIEARPEELRNYLEEAAGISRYKERRRDTELRIEHTRENLERLTDLREELGRQMAQLQRQAQAAERYRALRETERRLKAELLVVRWRDLQAELTSRTDSRDQQQLLVDQRRAEMTRTEHALEEQRGVQFGLSSDLADAEKATYEVAAEIARCEQQLKHAGERKVASEKEHAALLVTLAELEEHLAHDQVRLERLRDQRAELQPRVEAMQASAVELESSSGVIQQRLDALEQQRSHLITRLADAETALSRQESAQTHAEQEIERLIARSARLRQLQADLVAQQDEPDLIRLAAADRAAEQTLTAALAALTEIEARLEVSRLAERGAQDHYSEQRVAADVVAGRLQTLQELQLAALGRDEQPVLEWLQANGLTDRPRLIESLRVDEKWRAVVEALLSDQLNSVVLANLTTLADVEFEGGVLGQSGLAFIMGSGATAAAPGPGSAPPLLEQVESPCDLSPLLGQVFRAESLAAALALQSELRPGQFLVTPANEWVGANWLYFAGGSSEGAGRLDRAVEVDRLSAEQIELNATLESAGENQQKALQHRQQAETDQRRARAVVDDARGRQQQSRQALTEAQSRQARVQDQLADIESQLAEAQGRQGEIEQALEASSSKIAADRAEVETLRLARGELEESFSDHRGQAQAAAQRLSVHRGELHQMQVGLQAVETEIQILEQTGERLKGQQRDARRNAEGAADLLRQADGPVESANRLLQGLLAQRQTVEAALTRARDAAAAGEQRQRELDGRRLQLEEGLRSVTAAFEAQQRACQEAEIKAEAVAEQLSESGQVLEEIFSGLEAGATESAWISHLSQVEQRIQRLGAINLAAIEEYERVKERKSYLDDQHQDLVAALETMATAIASIDRETRSRFRELYEQVNQGLGQMFPRLFGGGEASLTLQGDDLLAGGVLFSARPPGKKNSTIQALSGGEKALSALALVFAIFELNPAPFCMLDEVDAPLDDANVGRYCDLIRQMAERVQFVFVTHNKTTMELADQLIGVTMAEPGASHLVSVDMDAAVKMANI